MKKLQTTEPLAQKVSVLIDTAQGYVAKAINKSMVMLYWQIGKTIQEELVKEQRAEYGKRIVQTLSEQLTQSYGKGYSRSNLNRMVEFYKYYPDFEIGATMSHQLSWSHIVEILKQKDPLRRGFYMALCANEGWSVRELSGRIDSMLFERTAISKKGEETIYNDLKKLRDEKEMSIELFLKDPYMLDFLGLNQAYNEQNLERAVLVELQQFILEFGNDFAFMARQKRITIDQEDYYIDLLFYHRKLKRLVVIELKLGKFKPEHKGQLELYLRWLDKYERQEGENQPIGLLLCSEKSDKMVELLELDKSGIHVATYLTELPPIELFKLKLEQSVTEAQKRLNTQSYNEA
jgi:predicted nuclease of restriction endonuclease-like (RecB) superfamily